MQHDSSAPKYRQLIEYLKGEMTRGKIAPGELLSSENILAQSFGLSRHTVRQALNTLEHEGWIKREQGRGTFCAGPPVSGSVKSVAVLTTYISDYIFPLIIRGVEDVLSAAGFTLVLANTNNDKAKEEQCLKNLLSQPVAGVIVEPTRSARPNNNIQYYREMEYRGIPYLMVHAIYPGLEPAFIKMEDYRGGYLAAKHLLHMGHRRIVGIFKRDDLQGVERERGFRGALAEYHIEPAVGIVGNYDTEEKTSYPYQFARELLGRTEAPTAFVCYNDHVALQVLEAIRNAGLKVPDDVSLVGYDDSSLAVATEVKLTTIRHPQTELGREAARMMLGMLTGKLEKPSLIYQPELVIRSSVRAVN